MESEKRRYMPVHNEFVFDMDIESDQSQRMHMTVKEIADRLNALESERDRLREALRIIANDNWTDVEYDKKGQPVLVQSHGHEVAESMQSVAIQALKGGGDE